MLISSSLLVHACSLQLRLGLFLLRPVLMMREGLLIIPGRSKVVGMGGFDG